MLERLFATLGLMLPSNADLTSPETVEQIRRSIAMLSPGAPALNREEAMKTLGALKAALWELRQ